MNDFDEDGEGDDASGDDTTCDLADRCFLALGVSCKEFNQANVKASDASAGAAFGHEVSLSADGLTMAVGALEFPPDPRPEGYIESGTVYVFEWVESDSRSDSHWSETFRQVTPSVDIGTGQRMDDRFGFSVALSSDGNTLAVGAPFTQGAVYVYRHDGEDWDAAGERLVPSVLEAGDRFGWSVSLSRDGSSLAVGADARNTAGEANSGAAYVFTRIGATWNDPDEHMLMRPDPTAGETRVGATFGFSIAMSADGSTVAVGARGENRGTGAVYTFTGDDWSEVGSFHGVLPDADTERCSPSGTTLTGDAFGWRVALSDDGNTLAVSALLEDSSAMGINGADAEDNDEACGSGAVYVYDLSSTPGTRLAYLKSSNTDAGDGFGYSIALSDDGLVLAVGARHEDGAGAGVNPPDSIVRSNSGAVYLFDLSESVTERAYIKSSDTQTFDEFGFSVDLSSDGTKLAVGARFGDTDTTNSGTVHARCVAPRDSRR